MKGINRGALALGVAVAALAVPASANHQWGSYHWARTSNPFTIKLGNNLTGAWVTGNYLGVASSDWSKSTVLDTAIVPGSSSSRKCAAVSGMVQVCNNTYGQNGWLGLASISASGSHITQGTVKLNDTYFNMAQYNNPAERQMVTCQEVGHTFGLDHQDTNQTNTNLGSCMDYTTNPLGPPDNEHPNQHDYDELVTIYSHLDSTTTIASAAAMPSMRPEIGDTPASWGRAVHFQHDGRPDTYLRVDGPNMVTLTHVYWADGEGPPSR